MVSIAFSLSLVVARARQMVQHSHLHGLKRAVAIFKVALVSTVSGAKSQVLLLKHIRSCHVSCNYLNFCRENRDMGVVPPAEMASSGEPLIALPDLGDLLHANTSQTLL